VSKKSQSQSYWAVNEVNLAGGSIRSPPNRDCLNDKCDFLDTLSG